MTNLPATLSTLKQQIGALTDRLAPARPDFVAECLDRLKSGGMMVPKTIAPADFIREYTMALAGVPACGLALAVTRLKRGEYPDVRHDFLPLPAMLAAIARLETKAIRDDLIRLREREQAIAAAATPRQRTSDEEMARIRALHAAFKAAHAESRLPHPAPPDEMTPEQRQYWSSIQEIGDAPEITPRITPGITKKQRALRGKTAASMTGAARHEEQEAAE